MESFKRIFKYIRPQWPRVIVVIFSAIVVAALLSLSFMTIIPLLNVMLGQEGLHSWVDRKSCDWKYGVDFHVAETRDFIDSNDDVAHHLLVIKVERDGLADLAGLKPMDKIVGVANLVTTPQTKEIPFPVLLEELATIKEKTVTIQVIPLSQDQSATKLLEVNTPYNKAYIDSLQWGVVKKVRWKIKTALIEQAQRMVGLLPRDKGQDNTTRAVTFIIVVIG